MSIDWIAAENKWFVFLIVAIWVVSSILEGKRKRELKKRRQLALKKQSEEQESGVQATENQAQLRKAEEDVQTAEYQTVAKGQNMEVGINQLLEALRPPEEEERENLKAQSEALEVENGRLRYEINRLNKIISKPQKTEPRRKNFNKNHAEHSFDKPQGVQQNPQLPSGILPHFSGDALTKSIIAMEVLSKPKAFQ